VKSQLQGRLRLRAENLLARRPPASVRRPTADAQRLLHELQVHQIELEMQNEQLRRSQSELETARERLLLPYEAAPVGFLSLDDKGIIREANLAAAQLLNLGRLKLIGQKLTGFITPGSQAEFYLRRRALADTGKNQTCELRLLRTNNPPFIARVELVMERIGSELATRFLVMMSDITEQKQGEARLREAHAQLEQRMEERTKELLWANAALADEKAFSDSLIRLAPAIIAVLDEQGNLIRTNAYAERLIGFPFSEIQGRDIIGKLVPQIEQPRVRHLLREALRGRAMRQVVAPLRTRAGRVRQIEWFTQPLANAEGQVSAVLAVGHDITDRLNLEWEVLHISEREQRRIAQDLHDGLGQLLVGTIHLVNHLQQDLANKSIPEARRLSRIMEVINEAIWQTRSLAKGLHPVESEPNGLMSALDSLAIRTQKLVGIPCQFICPRSVLVANNEVATHLFRIAQEAVNNAIKHGRPRQIQIRLAAVRGRTSLAITDDGTGMLVSARKPAGMGLRIMHYRARMIGGSFSVQTGVAGGTTIVCAVPPAEPAAGKRGLRKKQP
jgi:PAS domain S-box-containing protein